MKMHRGRQRSHGPAVCPTHAGITPLYVLSTQEIKPEL